MISERTSNINTIFLQPFAKDTRLSGNSIPTPPCSAQAGVYISQHAPAVTTVLSEMYGEKNQPNSFIGIPVACVKECGPFGVEHVAVRIGAVWVNATIFQYLGVF